MVVEAAAHPYSPADLQLPDYVPNVLPSDTVFSVFAVSSIIIFALAWFMFGLLFNKIPKIDRLQMCWFTFSGLCHMIVEGYVVFFPEFYKDTTGFILAEIWKEYCKGDSRFAGRETTAIAVEGLTAVLGGPLCLLAVFAIATRKSYSCILQFAISVGQLSGTWVYILAAFLNGDQFAASRRYYYGYYIFLNSIWIIAATLISLRCWRQICTLYEAHGQVKTKRG